MKIKPVGQILLLFDNTHRWRAYVQTKHEGKMVLKRRELEVCILSYLADAIRCGDLYITGSEEFTDFRVQLLPWEECLTYLDDYCEGVGLPNNADEFIANLQEKLRNACQKTDDLFPENTHFTMDENGEPHLKRLPTSNKISKRF